MRTLYTLAVIALTVTSLTYAGPTAVPGISIVLATVTAMALQSWQPGSVQALTSSYIHGVGALVVGRR